MSIILNVSGKIFRVSREIICRSGLFDAMLTDCVIDGEIMVDRSPKLFKHVYAYLLDNRYPYPKEYYFELDYYLVSYDINLLYDPLKQLANRIEVLEKDMVMLNDKMFNMFDEIQKHFAETNWALEKHIPELYLSEECPFRECNNKCYHWQSCYYHSKECVIVGCDNVPDDIQARCRDHMFN